jgi:hypothetical protein
MEWFFSPWFFGVYWSSAWGGFYLAFQSSARSQSAGPLRNAVRAACYAAVGYMALGLLVGWMDFQPPFADYAVHWPFP